MFYFRLRPVATFNTLCSLFGIHSHVIDFGKIVNGDVVSSRSNYFHNFCILVCLAFVISYPVAIWRLLLNYHMWASKSINLYLNYMYYTSRYFVVVSILFMQARYRHELHARQCATIQIFRQIYSIHRSVSIKDCKRQVTALNAIDWCHIVKLILAVVLYTYMSYLKLSCVFQGISSMNAYDIFWYYCANPFIRMYASMFSISVLQEAKLYELMSHTIKAIKRAADESFASTAPGAPSTDCPIDHVRRQYGGKRIRDVEQQWEKPWSGTFEKHIQLLMELHEKLRANTLKLNKLHSIQAFSVVGNGFMNLVSQVKCNMFAVDTHKASNGEMFFRFILPTAMPLDSRQDSLCSHSFKRRCISSKCTSFSRLAIRWRIRYEIDVAQTRNNNAMHLFRHADEKCGTHLARNLQ